MKIHTNLTRHEMITLDYGIDGVYAEYTEHGSRKRGRAFDFHLVADQREGRRRGNSGHYGAGYDYAATWDEWGIVFARLFALDPEADCYAYHGAADYHFKTGNRFADFGRLIITSIHVPDHRSRMLPEVSQVHFNAHDQHRWTWDQAQSEQDTAERDDGGKVSTYWCTCSAIRRHMHYPKKVAS
jgi:hypothetical protein